MTIKRILIPLPGTVKNAGEIDLALSVAKAFGAHVEALFITEPPPAIRGGMGSGEYRYTGGAATAAQIDSVAESRRQYAEEAREELVQACAKNSIPIVATDAEPGELPVASWRESEGSYVTIAVQRAAAFDLMVAASAAVMGSLKDIAEQSLLQTRRPVLLAPSRQETKLTDDAMIAWDESPQCWHAVSAALPFLKLAKTVKVISVDKHAQNRQASQAELLAYLRCHGVIANADVVAPHLRSVGDTLLAAAGEHDVGLLVMGAYSHSRWREMLLGGATHHVLKHAAARPVLMAH